ASSLSTWNRCCASMPLVTTATAHNAVAHTVRTRLGKDSTASPSFLRAAEHAARSTREARNLSANRLGGLLRMLEDCARCRSPDIASAPGIWRDVRASVNSCDRPRHVPRRLPETAETR